MVREADTVCRPLIPTMNQQHRRSYRQCPTIYSTLWSSFIPFSVRCQSTLSASARAIELDSCRRRWSCRPTMHSRSVLRIALIFPPLPLFLYCLVVSVLSSSSLSLVALWFASVDGSSRGASGPFQSDDRAERRRAARRWPGETTTTRRDDTAHRTHTQDATHADARGEKGQRGRSRSRLFDWSLPSRRRW